MDQSVSRTVKVDGVTRTWSTVLAIVANFLEEFSSFQIVHIIKIGVMIAIQVGNRTTGCPRICEWQLSLCKRAIPLIQQQPIHSNIGNVEIIKTIRVDISHSNALTESI